MKFNVITKNTGPHEPPSKSLGSIDLEETPVSTEGGMVQEIFARHGTGHYLIQTNIGPQNKFQNIWEGEIQLKSSRKILFEASLNVLPDLTDVEAATGSRTGQLKKVDVPENGRERARRIVVSRQK